MPVYKTTPTKDGRQWLFQVSYKALDGTYKKYRSKAYSTKKEAEKAEAAYLIEKGKYQKEDFTFNEIIALYLEEKKTTVKPQTYDREVVMCNHVAHYLGRISVGKLTPSQYDQFRSAVGESDYSISYKNKMLKQVRSLVSFSERKFGISNKCPKMQKDFTDNAPKKEMQIYTLEEFERFIEVADNEIYKAFFTFLFFTGCRLNEANALQWSDIDFEKNICSINKSVVTKTKSKDTLYLITTPKTKMSIRNIPLCNRALECLKTLDRNKPFVFGGDRPLAETTITKAKDRYAERAGLHRIRIHDFRHSFTSMLVNNLGVDNIVLISRMLGHSSIEETLQTYSHLWNNSYNQLINKLNEL